MHYGLKCDLFPRNPDKVARTLREIQPNKHKSIENKRNSRRNIDFPWGKD